MHRVACYILVVSTCNAQHCRWSPVMLDMLAHLGLRRRSHGVHWTASRRTVMRPATASHTHWVRELSACLAAGTLLLSCACLHVHMSGVGLDPLTVAASRRRLLLLWCEVCNHMQTVWRGNGMPTASSSASCPPSPLPLATHTHTPGPTLGPRRLAQVVGVLALLRPGHACALGRAVPH